LARVSVADNAALALVLRRSSSRSYWEESKLVRRTIRPPICSSPGAALHPPSIDPQFGAGREGQITADVRSVSKSRDIANLEALLLRTPNDAFLKSMLVAIHRSHDANSSATDFR
jgi:hypothetical protein